MTNQWQSENLNVQGCQRDLQIGRICDTHGKTVALQDKGTSMVCNKFVSMIEEGCHQ